MRRTIKETSFGSSPIGTIDNNPDYQMYYKDSRSDEGEWFITYLDQSVVAYGDFWFDSEGGFYTYEVSPDFRGNKPDKIKGNKPLTDIILKDNPTAPIAKSDELLSTIVRRESTKSNLVKIELEENVDVGKYTLEAGDTVFVDLKV